MDCIDPGADLAEMRTDDRLARFWWVYAGAWLALAAVYAGIFVVEGRPPGVETVIAALANIVPAALLGVGVVGTSDRLRWPPRVWPLFVGAHAVLALVYAGLWFLGVGLAFAVVGVLRAGAWSFSFLTGPAVGWVLFQGTVLYAVIAGLSYTVQVARQLRVQQLRAARAESRAVRAEALRAAAELHALRARLNPHFLFNTLHTLNALVQRDREAASQAIERFAALLRYTLDVREGSSDDGHGSDHVEFRAEWRFTLDYLALEELRLADRLRVLATVEDDALDVLVPAFTLQPLVENAVRHGVAPRPHGGCITLRASTRDDRLRIELSDDGPGAVPGTSVIVPGHGIDLVQRRLTARYGEQASLEIVTSPGTGFSVTVELPADPSPRPGDADLAGSVGQTRRAPGHAP